MKRFTQLAGSTVAIYRPNIDTDQIIPKQFLKRIERTGYGEFLFHDWRFHSDGTPDNSFILNDTRFNSASILIAGANFGCGSSREHAPWSLMDHGFSAIIAPSFADIFYNNSLKNGLLPIVLEESVISQLVDRSVRDASYSLIIDLEDKTVSDGADLQTSFDIDEFRRQCLLNGLDDIALTLQFESDISAYEDKMAGSPQFLFLS